MSTNRTHRTRLARALAAVADISYQAALTRVVRAAEAGLLPDPLDAAGMRHALDVLLAGTGRAAAGTTSSALGLERRYDRLAQICGDRPQPGVRERVARARALGVPAVRSQGRLRPGRDARRSWPSRTTPTCAPTGGSGSSPPAPARTAPWPRCTRPAVTRTGTSR